MPEVIQNSTTGLTIIPEFHSVVGDFRLHEFRSKIFRNTRMLRVWLPPGYRDPDSVQRYPVLYLNDGQNLFENSTSFTGVEWQVDEAADRLVRDGEVLPLIVVGIDNTGHDRLREYIPYRTFSPRVLRPAGKRYPEFLQREVMPFINQRYRTLKGPQYTGLGGSSLGGLISLYTAIAAPGVFGRLLVESPSLFVAGRQVLRESERVRDWPGRVFLGIGTHETGRSDRNSDFVSDLLRLATTMRSAGLGDGRLLMEIGEGATHSEEAWARRFPQALKFLFGTGK